jgi:AmmeMemoRadiSam system protein A
MVTLAKPEKMLLLRLARTAIERRVLEGVSRKETTEELVLKQPAGAFVTLHLKGELRGCIGRIRALDPLEAVVQEMAVAAAMQDPRFSPLRREEVAEVEIEISVLSPLRKIERIEEIEVGRDGLLVTAGTASGLLLPQVASEQGWDRETFLSHTCWKAGLDMNHWKTGDLLIEAFSAEVFSEQEL